MSKKKVAAPASGKANGAATNESKTNDTTNCSSAVVENDVVKDFTQASSGAVPNASVFDAGLHRSAGLERLPRASSCTSHPNNWHRQQVEDLKNFVLLCGMSVDEASKLPPLEDMYGDDYASSTGTPGVVMFAQCDPKGGVARAMSAALTKGHQPGTPIRDLTADEAQKAREWAVELFEAYDESVAESEARLAAQAADSAAIVAALEKASDNGYKPDVHLAYGGFIADGAGITPIQPDAAAIEAHYAKMHDENGFVDAYTLAHKSACDASAGGMPLTSDRIEQARDAWRFRNKTLDMLLKAAGGDPIAEAEARRQFDAANEAELSHARMLGSMGMGGVQFEDCFADEEMLPARTVNHYIRVCREDMRFPSSLRTACVQVKNLCNTMVAQNNNTVKNNANKWDRVKRTTPQIAAKLTICMLDVQGKEPRIYHDRETIAWFEPDDPMGPLVLGDDPSGGDTLQGALRPLALQCNPEPDDRWMKLYRDACYDELRRLGYERDEQAKHPYNEVWYRNKIVNVETQEARDYTPADARINAKLAIDVTLEDDGIHVRHPEEPVARFDEWDFDGHPVRKNVEFKPTGFMSRLSGDDEDVIDANWQVVSNAARGGATGQVPILHGSGGIGKSVFMKCLRAMYGEARCGHVPFENLAKDSSLLSLQGKAGNFPDEAAVDGHISTDELRDIKTIITGGKKDTFVKFRNNQDLSATIPMAFPCNGVSSWGEKGFPMERRLMVVPEAQTDPKTLMFEVEDFMCRPDVVEWMIDQAIYGREGRGTFRAFQKNAATKAAFSRTITTMDTLARAADGTLIPFLKENDVRSINAETCIEVCQADLAAKHDNGRIKLTDKYQALDRILKPHGYRIVWKVENVKADQKDRRAWDQSHDLREAIKRLDCVEVDSVPNGKDRWSSPFLDKLTDNPVNLTKNVTAVVTRVDMLDQIKADPTLNPMKILKAERAAKRAATDAAAAAISAQAANVEAVDDRKAYDFMLATWHDHAANGVTTPEGNPLVLPTFDEWVSTGRRNMLADKLIAPSKDEAALRMEGAHAETDGAPWWCVAITDGDGKVLKQTSYVHVPWSQLLASRPDVLATLRPDGWTPDGQGDDAADDTTPPDPAPAPAALDTGTGKPDPASGPSSEVQAAPAADSGDD